VDDATVEAIARRDALGRRVREVWIEWAKTQPNPKPSWVVPYDELDEADKEADRCIGSALYGDGIEVGMRMQSAMRAALPDPRPTEAEAEDALHDIGMPYRFRVVAVLRDHGCFRPEPAAEWVGGDFWQADPPTEAEIEAEYFSGRGAEPVPAAEPPHLGATMLCDACDGSGDTFVYQGEGDHIENPCGQCGGRGLIEQPSEPVPVPMVTVRRRRVLPDEIQVPADQIPEGWEPVDG